MRTLFKIALLVGGILPAMADETHLTEGQVSEIGKMILTSKSQEEYRDQFSWEKPRYDPKTKIWRFEWTPKGALFPCMPLPFFEIRDRDAHQRIGSLSGNGYHPASSEKFRMSPLFQRKITRILER